MELIQEIERLKEKGYSQEEIAAKLDVSDSTIKGLIALRQADAERLLEAVVNGTVPLTVAMDIARADTPEAQRELLTACETKQLNGVAIRVVNRLMDKRRLLGKQAPEGASRAAAQSTADGAATRHGLHARGSAPEGTDPEGAHLRDQARICRHGFQPAPGQ